MARDDWLWGLGGKDEFRSIVSGHANKAGRTLFGSNGDGGADIGITAEMMWANPYAGVNDLLMHNGAKKFGVWYDASRDEMTARLTNWLEEDGGTTRVGDSLTDWESVANSIRTYLSNNNVIPELQSVADGDDKLNTGITALIATVVADAITSPTSPLKSAITAADLQTTTDLVDRANFRSAVIAEGVTTAALQAELALRSTTTLANAATGGFSLLANVRDMEDSLDTNAISIMTGFSAGSISNTNNAIDTIAANILAELSTAVTSAITAAGAAIDSEVIDSVVANFEDSSFDPYMRSVNRLNAGFVDINAAMGSAFILANANLENGYRRDIEAFRSNLVNQIYSQTLGTYLQAFSSNLSNSLQVYSDNIHSHLNAYGKGLDDRVTSFLTGLGEYVKTYLSNLSLYASTYNNALGVGAGITADVLNKQMQSFSDIYQKQVATYVSEVFGRRDANDRMLSNSMSSVFTNEYSLATFRHNLAKLKHELFSFASVGFREEALDNLAWKKNAVEWEMDTMSRAVNILAGEKGSGVTTSSKSGFWINAQSALAAVSTGVYLTQQIGQAVKDFNPKSDPNLINPSGGADSNIGFHSTIGLQGSGGGGGGKGGINWAGIGEAARYAAEKVEEWEEKSKA